jgi:beta-mannosidase
VELIRKYKGDLKESPGTHQNPLWNRQPWWIDWPKFVQEKRREPADLEEFVTWSQARQAAALTLAARVVKSRFPACGGLIIWMGHDSFPCTSNTSIVDFDGNPKPAAIQLGKIFRQES